MTVLEEQNTIANLFPFHCFDSFKSEKLYRLVGHFPYVIDENELIACIWL
jgi:hypothetical protein